MTDGKYTIEPDNDPPDRNLDFLEAREINDVEARVSSIQFTEDTKGRIKPNGERPAPSTPKVRVDFETEKTSFSSDFVFDPLVSDDLNEDDNRFTSLVSSAYVEWECFNDIIGSSVKLRSPYNTTRVLIQNPLSSHNYNVLSQFEPTYFYNEGLSEFFVKVFVNWVKNRSYGRAEISDFEVRRGERVKVYFKLKSSDVFTSTFKIQRNESNSDTDRFGMFNRREPKNRIYDFWDLCEDALGFIPGDSEYDRIIGEEVPVFYRAKWMVKK